MSNLEPDPEGDTSLRRASWAKRLSQRAVVELDRHQSVSL
jgi:hypothetical protein